MANILYKTDYYTNVYLLYLDNVPVAEVVGIPGTEAGEAGPRMIAASESTVTVEVGERY